VSRTYTHGREASTAQPRSGKILLAFASTVILGSGSRGTHDPNCLSHDSESRTISNPVRTSQETHYVSRRTTNWLMLFRETTAVYCENRMLMLKHVVNIVTSVL
jgi:hypothetical protein